MSGKRRITLRGLEFLYLINWRVTVKFSRKSETLRPLSEITVRKVKHWEKTVIINKLESQYLNINEWVTIR